MNSPSHQERKAVQHVIAPVSRAVVFNAIDSERDYQDSIWGDALSGGREPGSGQSGGDRTLDEFILYMAGYQARLTELGATFADPKKKLDFVRKMAGLAVACMEQHGAPQREGFERDV